MAPKRCITVFCATLIFARIAQSGELEFDSRHMDFDNNAWRLVGENAEQLVTLTERGLLVRIPRKEREPQPVGFAPRGVVLHGDFEIIAEWELLRYDRPPRGDWVCAGIVVEFPGTASGALTIERMIGPDGADHFNSDIMTGSYRGGRLSSKQVPTSSRSGKLSLERSGSTVRAYYTDGSNSFKLLRVEEMGSGDAVISRFGAATSSKAHGIDVLFKSVTIKAEELVSEPPAQVDSTSSWDPLVLSGMFWCIVLAGFAILELRRYRSQRTRPSR
jgi:hypothetical protein